LIGYISSREALPRPSPARGRSTVTLPPLVAAKLAVYSAMLERHVSNADLAERLGMSERAVRRLLDLDHRSDIGQIEAALAALGKRLEITVSDAA
jgi:antitoxin HicB